MTGLYRSNHPDVWAEIRAFRESSTLFSLAVRAFIKAYDLAPRTALVSHGFGKKNLVGFSCESGDWRNPPRFWRYVERRGMGMLVPYRSKAKGDPAIVKAFDAIGPVDDYRNSWPGMPAFTGICAQPATHADKAEEWIYCDWGDKNAPNPDDVDLSIWEPVKRSEYHRLAEEGVLEIPGGAT